MSVCCGGAAPYYCPESPCDGCPHRAIYSLPIRTGVAQKCPVCGGSGQVPLPIPDYGYGGTSTEPMTKTCHGCNGCGWVVV